MESVRTGPGGVLPAGWTKKALAAELGVSRMSVWRWMSGREPWPAPRLSAAAAALGVEESTLVPGGSA